MNISTYEARIKALEDQLNPPAPGGSTGLLSVTVSPDITLDDGTSLNAKLAAMMPLRWEDGTVDPEYPTDHTMDIEFNTESQMGSSHTVTVKPSVNRYAMSYDKDQHPVFGQLGQEITFDADLSDGNLVATFGAADSDNVDTITEYLSIHLQVGAR